MLSQVIKFLAMDGYAFYVWSAFIAFLIIFIGLWIVPYLQLKKQMNTKSHE